MRIVLPSLGGISLRSVYDADQEGASPATMARGRRRATGAEVDDLGERDRAGPAAIVITVIDVEIRPGAQCRRVVTAAYRFTGGDLTAVATSLMSGAAGRRCNAVGGFKDAELDDAADGGAPWGGRAMMSAHVITLGLGAGMNQDVQAWFRQFNYMPPLPLTAVRVDTHEGAQTFEHLLKLVAASPHQRFILMAHGHEDGSGLFLKLAPGSAAATEHKFLGRFMELAEGAAFNDFDRKTLGIDKAGLGRILDLMQKIRAKRIDCIEFRACNLGRNTLGLDRFRRFFGARLAGAPDLHTFFGHGPVITDRKMLDTHERGHDGGTWETYEFPHWLRPRDVKPDLVCCFRINAHNKPNGGHIAADSPARLDAWIKKYVMAGGRQPKGDMALHGLWNTTRQIILEPEDINEPLGGWGGPTHKRLILPLTENYRKHIIYAR